MQHMTPPQGRLFPDPPQEPQQTPRFQSTLQQAYEPQQRMQQTGSFPTYHSARYTTSSMQPLHSTQPVTTMPPMATMPTAQAYQQQLQQPVVPQPLSEPAPQSAPSRDDSPVIVNTLQGAPVLVTLEQLEEALCQLKARNGLTDLNTDLRGEIHAEPAKKRKGKKTKALHKAAHTENKAARKARPLKITFSVTWFIFGVIGLVSTIIFLLEYFGIPLLVYLEELTGGKLG